MKIDIKIHPIGLVIISALLVLLRVFGVIDWAWYWLLAPIWFFPVFFMSMGLLIIGLAFVATIFGARA